MADIYFSDFFRVGPETIEEHGAFNISLVSDLPLFIDPFLLFNSTDEEYGALHAEIIRYMRFLKDVTLSDKLTRPLVLLWFAFPEVRQTWLGVSKHGNKGRGLGRDFAEALNINFHSTFRDFGEEKVTAGSHLEKLCLIREGVGRDMVSDFTTNLIKPFLCEYTQAFATRRLQASQRAVWAVPRVRFNYDTRSWMSERFELPVFRDDYVLLTPKDILTKDEAWINRRELVNNFRDIADALTHGELRAQINEYFLRMLPLDGDVTNEEETEAIDRTLERFPIVLDYYIQDKEGRGEEAIATSREKIELAEKQFISQVLQLVHQNLEPGGFYNIPQNTYEEAMARLLFFKDAIENKGGHHAFYVDGRPIRRESDVQIMYRLTWFASPVSVTSEANDGRGPADFKLSKGAADTTLVEFKLAKNTKLERNLAKQTDIYEKASDATHPSLKAIVYFSDAELERTLAILKRLGLTESPHVVLIDARSDNKPSGSRA